MYVVKYIKEKEKTKANKQKNKTNLVQKPIYTHTNIIHVIETYKKLKLLLKQQQQKEHEKLK